MSGASSIPDATELLAHLGWVQRLARALVRDAAGAEDLAQEAVRVTLEQPRGRVGSGATMRAWLRGVVRRLALDRFRSERSRSARERGYAPPESTPTTFEVVARGARQRRVVEAVMELAEPCRSTILYRYLDELSTRDVAARTGVTEELVRKRLERGRELLREKLDREFATDTRNWALALFSLPGAVAVTVKMKLAVAAVVLVAAAVTWRAVMPAQPTSKRATESPIVSSEVATRAEPPPSDVVAERTAAEAIQAESGIEAAVRSVPGEGALLRVRVIGRDRHACMAGRLACFWSESFWFGHGERAHSLNLDLAGEVTEVVLPAAAASAELTASVAAEPASPRVKVERLGLRDDGKALGRRDVREITIDLAEALAGTRLSGRILVDGEPRVPKGLRIRIEGPWEQARIHALDARYEVGLDSTSEHLFVVSEETVPRQLDVDPKETQRDLDLSTERTLKLTIVDRRTGRPLPERELFVEVSAVVARESIFRSLWRDASHFPKTDAQGVAVVRGIPPEGRVTVRRDAKTTQFERVSEAGHKMYGERLREPLLEFALEPGMPMVIERTLALDAEELHFVLRGTLASSLRAATAPGEPPIEVKWARLDDERHPDVQDEALALDAEGRFQLDVDPGRDYRIWAERDRMRLSDVAMVKVDEAEPAPILLSPRPGTEIRLRIVRCPSSGFVSIYVEDPGAVSPRGLSVPARGGEIERRIVVDAPTWISVGWEQERGRESGKTQRVRVDPATTSIVEVDLEVGNARPVHLELTAGEVPSESQLWLEPLDTPRGKPVSTISVFFRGAESDAPAVIDSGRYLAFLHGMPGLVAAEVRIADGPPEVSITVTFDLEEHERSELGAGVQLERVGSIDLDTSWRGVCTLRFADRPDLANVEIILLPEGAKFTLLAE